jgi:hypothetical protein
MHVLALAATWLMLLNPFSTAGKSTPQLSLTASGSTSIGLQIFANSNLSGGSAPTGSITFRLFGPGDTTCASAMFTSTVPVSGQSMNSAHYTTAAAGTYRWTSAYGGDTNNNPVGPTSCSAPSASVVVQVAATGLSVTGPAPSAGAIHGVATLAGGINPTGTISFLLSGPGDQFCSQAIFTSSVAVVSGNGAYSSGSYHPTTTGTYRWRASYSGDTNNGATAVTACLDQNDSVNVTSVSQPPAAALSPSALTFAAQVVGTSGPVQTVTVSNTGGSNLTISGLAASGPAAADFATGNDHCTGATVAPGGTCTVTVGFTPSAVGTRTATLVVTDNAAGSPQGVALSGQATADRGLLTYPVAGQAGVDTTRPFTWAPASPGQAYFLVIGTTQFGTDLVSSGVLSASQAAYNVPALPTGRTLYATLLTETGGSWSLYQAITFTAAPGMGTLTSPVDGQTGVAKSPMFSWSTIPQGQAYYLVVGTTRFGNDVVNSGALSATTSSLGGVSLPPGKTLYATLLTMTGGSWTRYQAITFTTA